MYVAITRAKRYLHISYSDVRSNYGEQEKCKPSQFIAEIPTRLVRSQNENQDIYQPPKKKLTGPMVHNGFVTGKNLLHVVQLNKRK